MREQQEEAKMQARIIEAVGRDVAEAITLQRIVELLRQYNNNPRRSRRTHPN